MQAARKQFDDTKTALVAISNDSEKDTTALRDRLGITFPMISDPDLSIIRGYGVREGNKGARPATFVIDRGPIVFAKVGENAADRPTTQEILDAVRTAQAR